MEILFQKYLNKTATDAEKREFFEFVRQPGSGEILRTLSEKYPVAEDPVVQLPDEASHQILTAVLASDKPDTVKIPAQHAIRRRWMSYAAAVLLLVIAGASYVFFRRDTTEKVVVAGNQVIKDALPGHNGAVLTLSNGRSVVLDTAKNGKLMDGFTKSGDKITVEDGKVEYATLVTPMGRQQQVTLSDGTKVWLNAGSSMRFPTRFSENQRKVEITGEVYFEVAQNATRPFMVSAGKEVIKVLGTHFNVNAYADEQMVKTTLLEGSVKINDKAILQPGEQYGGGIISKVDADASVAWVYGYFQFEHADIRTVMRQLSRWYDVEVRYEGRITSELFGGELQRNLKLSEVLELLSGTGIHYTLNGKMLTIRP
ncbi:FecR family protein [Flavitalea sp. BT771]|uniref:FecR family protein n=1 Tax=Flavitalea sp. BT771 TaxID=3063329 RepID=UPI00294B55AA|nr:FecR domain-containing protein [Flavitalea sp. BT771]